MEGKGRSLPFELPLEEAASVVERPAEGTREGGGKVRGTSGRGRSRPFVDSNLVSCRVKASSRGLIRVRSSQGQSGQVTSRSVKSFESKSRSVKEGQSSSDVKTSRVKSCES